MKGGKAVRDAPIIPMGDDTEGIWAPDAAPQRKSVLRPWQSGADLSSASAFSTKGIGASAERFLSDAGFDRAPWLAVAFGCGILAWFGLKTEWQWIAAITVGLLSALGAIAVWRGVDERGHLRRSIVAVGLVFAAGIAVTWVRSEMVGAEPIDRPTIERVEGYVLDREDQPADDRIRLTLAVRDAETALSRKIRVNVPLDKASEVMAEGALVRARVRLMPPANPMLPGSYDFARAAWFKGLAATGSVLGDVDVIRPASLDGTISAIQRTLWGHVRERVDGSPGTIAAAFASGDRGAIAKADEEAMRDAGLTHLLAISGLHVSAVIAAAYFVALKLLALFPALALRVRLPLVAASVGALAGVSYTLLTGAQVPTVRACVAALLVLVALAMGRDALSMRMVAVAAGVVMLLWPESVVGPSFQMSFAAVIAIVALHTSERVKAFLAPREEPWSHHVGRRVLMLFITGLLIEIALMPIVLFHFHRAGVYGAVANVFAIPLVTFISMPLIAIGLVLDLVGLGAPVWWLVEKSLQILLGIAHFTASQPGAVKLMPQMTWTTIALFVAGGLWLALWQKRARLFGAIPVAIAMIMLLSTPVPDLLIGREGRHVGIVVEDPDGGARLVSLRNSQSSYARDNLLELSSVSSEPIPMSEWSGADCSPQFCVVTLNPSGRDWTLLLARNRDLVEEMALAAACERSDIVVADRYLPRSCKPKWLKADRRLLDREGGLAVKLQTQTITSVAASQGDHGWWRGEGD